MLDGTDLYSAFKPFTQDQPVELQVPSQPELPPKSGATSISSIDYSKERYDNNGIYQASQAPVYNAPAQEQKIAYALNNYKAQKQSTEPSYNNDGYFDKLFGKKRDFFKFIQLALIIVLGLSTHFIIKYYLQSYLNQSDMSPERQVILRLLYPLSILFILWNMKAFVL